MPDAEECLDQWWIQELQKWAVEFIGSGDCFDAQSQTPFFVRVECKIHIVNITLYMLTSMKVYARYSVKIKNLKKIKNGSMLDKDDGRNKDINRKEKAVTLGRIWNT